MEHTHQTHVRIRARDEAMGRLNRLTTGLALGALAGVGVFATVSAATIPGTSATSGQPAMASSGSASSTSSSTSSSSSASGLQSSGGIFSAQPGSGIVVSGGSR